MTDPLLTNEMKRHVVIVSLKVDHGDLEIARYLRVARLFDHKIRKELKKENDIVISVSKKKKKKKKHSTRSDLLRTPEFILKVKQTIDENRNQKLHVSEKTIRRNVHEDIVLLSDWFFLWLIDWLIKWLIGGARGVKIIVVGNGHGDTSSNSRRGWLHFT